MDRYSKIQSSVWSSDKFEQLEIRDRYVYLYLLSNQHANSIGFYKLKPGYAAVDLAMDSREYYKAIDTLSKASLIYYDSDSEVLFLPNFIKFNPFTNENHAKGSQSIADKLLDNPLYPLFYGELEKYCDKYLHVFSKPLERLSEDCRNTDTDTDTETDTETDTDTETNTDTEISLSDQEPTDDSQEPSGTSTGTRTVSIARYRYSDVQDWYNSICLTLPKCTVMSDKRKKLVKSLVTNLDGDYDKVKSIFEKANASNFLSGRDGSWAGCGFDWLMNYNNALKVLEGNYDNQVAKTGNSGKKPQGQSTKSSNPFFSYVQERTGG